MSEFKEKTSENIQDYRVTVNEWREFICWLREQYPTFDKDIVSNPEKARLFANVDAFLNRMAEEQVNPGEATRRCIMQFIGEKACKVAEGVNATIDSIQKEMAKWQEEKDQAEYERLKNKYENK